MGTTININLNMDLFTLQNNESNVKCKLYYQLEIYGDEVIYRKILY